MRPTFAEIRSRFEAERQAGGQLRTANDLPLSYEAITPEWLTRVLTGNRPDAQVVSHRLGEPDEGTSSRRRIFLDWNEAGELAGFPASVFCKGTPRLESRYLLAMNGGIEAEVTFYNLVRGGLAIEAPRPLFARFDPQTFNSIIILEDMTARVEFGKHAMEMPLERAQSQMKLLAVLHSKYYENPELGSTLSRFNDWEDYFAITVEEAGFGRGLSARLRRGRRSDSASAVPTRTRDLARHPEVGGASSRAAPNASALRSPSQELVRCRQRRDGAQRLAMCVQGQLGPRHFVRDDDVADDR